ncbi:MMPL family transporter [Blastococcus xanthinilyticus]|uniref:RND superfamily putative drug exporter n=1 Tax=Blastococcus xanthinilyticus TaxID=1564164 RepID=A0A5S5CYY5_9ACTN|nr:MMPL family transporter [Blastococcus xanthinilyticus]TYP88980.1 RND superfamily putative drug exporter [Blastococcus xanthinilyticus]
MTLPTRPPGGRHASGGSSTERVAGLLHRRRWWVLAAWVVLLAAFAVIGRPLPGLLTGGGWYVEGSQSHQAVEEVREGFLARGAAAVTVLVQDTRFTADDAEFAERVRDVTADVTGRGELEVSGAYGWTTLGNPAREAFVGEDRSTVLTLVSLDLDDGRARQLLPEVQQELTERWADEGLQVSLVGSASFWGEVTELSEQGLTRAELVTLPLILLILLLLYRSVVASVVSLVVAVTGIVLAFGILTVVTNWLELSVFVQSAVTMLGLGVGVDYALFVISRYTAELHGGATPVRAVATTLRTSGETVLSSALVIVLAMSTLFVVPLGVVHSIALGAMVVVAMAALTSVLVLPAILLLLGRRIDALRVPLPRRRSAAQGSAWESFTLRIMRRPWTVLLASVAVLAAVAWPALHLQVFTADARIVPESSPVRQGYDLLQEQFGAGAASPVSVVVQSPEPLAATDLGDELTRLQQRLADLDGTLRVDSALGVLGQAGSGDPLAALDPAVRGALPADARATVDHFVSADGRRLVLDVVPADPAASAPTRELVGEVRAAAAQAVEGTAAAAVVGGETAEGVDSNQAITDRLPWAVALMLGVIFVVLLLAFRSLLLPVKAIAVNLLSAAAAFGLLVLVFQDGVGAGLLGVEPSTHLQNIVPVLLLALLFSLSTDYEIFLLSRVREEWLATGDGTASVARGVARTGPLISGAAVLMVAVFGAFAFTSILPLQQLGLGLAVAIALDATVIRLLVVPASMRLMGAWNWWLPGRRRPGQAVRVPAGVPAPRPGPAVETTAAPPTTPTPTPTPTPTTASPADDTRSPV